MSVNWIDGCADGKEEECGRGDLPPPTMQTSTSSLSRSCCRGSKESSTVANRRHWDVAKAFRLVGEQKALGCWNRHRRRAGAKYENARELGRSGDISDAKTLRLLACITGAVQAMLEEIGSLKIRMLQGGEK